MSTYIKFYYLNASVYRALLRKLFRKTLLEKGKHTLPN